ncbi:MAG TPA: hypothetical protein DD001_18140 [Microcoleaceae bacterium UBA10368]|nr:hypothetical protein [Microcoleaceae cyanobacterium UBA10368]HCV29748.1 hypothetical protein [Microcoleaceae cyanobacterium UBA9251]
MSLKCDRPNKTCDVAQKPGFFRVPSLLPADLVKNPVSLSESISFVIDDCRRSLFDFSDR